MPSRVGDDRASTMSLRRLLLALAVLAVACSTLAPVGLAARGAVDPTDPSGGGARRGAAEAAIPPAPRVSTAPALPAIPAAWPSSKLELGLADAPGGAADLRASAPFAFRYQYLAGGVNTGNGWATWNTNGQFVSYYVADSVANSVTPVFPYYQLLQSNPATGGERVGEGPLEPGQPHHHGSLLQRSAGCSSPAPRARDAGRPPRRARPVGLHRAGDRNGRRREPRARPRSRAPAMPALAGLPNTAAGFARAIVRLRDQLAPNVILAYHLSVWGTNWDISYSNNSDPEVDALAARAAAFYQSLGAAFDVTFTDIGDRDADFKKIQPPGDGGAAWWDAADFARYARFIAGFVAGSGTRVVVWQIPLGNTKMRAQDDTWGHYQDNRVEWFLDAPGDGHLAVWRDAGVVALLYGGGAGGTTCACDAQGDGTHEPGADQRQHAGPRSAPTTTAATSATGPRRTTPAGALGIDPGSGGGGGGGGGRSRAGRSAPRRARRASPAATA